MGCHGAIHHRQGGTHYDAYFRDSTLELSKEIQTYHDHVHVAEWAEHDGQFVLICGSEVVGFYDAYEKTLTEGYTRFGMVPFLVKKVLSGDQQAQFVSRLLPRVSSSLPGEG